MGNFSHRLSTVTFQHGLAGARAELLQAHIRQALEMLEGAAPQDLAGHDYR